MAAEEKTRAQSARSHRFAKEVLGALVALLIGLVIAEIAVRGLAWISKGTAGRIATRDPLGMIYEPYGNFGYRPRPGKIERYPNGVAAHYNSKGYRGPVVSMPKPAGTYRIVLVGGSTAAGYGAPDDETIDAHLNRIVKSKFPGACVEVVNLAVGGYDSYQDYERMRVDGIPLSPDLVIIHSGINDVRNARYADLKPPPDPRTLLWESAMAEVRRGQGPSLWTRAKHYSYLLRLPGYVNELRSQRTTIAVTRVAEAYDGAIGYFETNVQRTIDLAIGAGAAVILSTPPSALSVLNKPTDPVEKSYWIRDAGTTEAYRRRLEARMKEIAERERVARRNVVHVTHRVPVEGFLDDAHLTGEGNQAVAQSLAQTISPYLAETLPRLSAKHAGCSHK